MGEERRIGVLLVNVGTPDSPHVRDVRRYLREFLSDPRVIDVPAPLRWLLLRLVILPFRPRNSARAYAAIWTDEGSPLLVHGRRLRHALAEQLGEGYGVALGMRYGSPSIEEALAVLEAAEVERILLLPLFPQYASATTASAVQKVFEAAMRPEPAARIEVLGAFYDDPAFVRAFAEVAAPELEAFHPDRVLMSFHGLPEHQVRRADPTGRYCLTTETCCATIVRENRECYRAQSFATARLLASALGLSPDRYTVSFQSRLGPAPWIRPYTDRLVEELPRRGVRRLAVLCPSFVADCLETLEEIGIRGRALFRASGGAELRLVPCLNAHPAWVRSLADRIRRAARGEREDPGKRPATP